LFFSLIDRCKIDEVLFTKEKEILLDYVKESEEMKKIYNELDECESLLESLENSLQGLYTFTYKVN
jgi:hypothetical protein